MNFFYSFQKLIHTLIKTNDSTDGKGIIKNDPKTVYLTFDETDKAW